MEKNTALTRDAIYHAQISSQNGWSAKDTGKEHVQANNNDDVHMP